MRQPAGQAGQNLSTAGIVVGPQVRFDQSEPVGGSAGNRRDGGVQTVNISDPLDDPAKATPATVTPGPVTPGRWPHDQRLPR